MTEHAVAGLEFLVETEKRTAGDSSTAWGAGTGSTIFLLDMVGMASIDIMGEGMLKTPDWMVTLLRYDLEIFFGGIGASVVLGGLVKLIANPLTRRKQRKKDAEFAGVFDSYVDQVVTEHGINDELEVFRELEPRYQDTLRIHAIRSRLSNYRMQEALELEQKLRTEPARTYVLNLIKQHIDDVPLDTLEKYVVFGTKEYREILTTGKMVELVDHYIRQEKTLQAEMLITERFPNTRKYRAQRKELYGKVAQAYFKDGNLTEAERVWRDLKDVQALKGPLLEAYRSAENHAKVLELTRVTTRQL